MWLILWSVYFMLHLLGNSKMFSCHTFLALALPWASCVTLSNTMESRDFRPGRADPTPSLKGNEAVNEVRKREIEPQKCQDSPFQGHLCSSLWNLPFQCVNRPESGGPLIILPHPCFHSFFSTCKSTELFNSLWRFPLDKYCY